MERQSRRQLLLRLVGTAMIFLGYGIHFCNEAFELLVPARPEPRNYNITPETGSLTLRGHAPMPVVDEIAPSEFVAVKIGNPVLTT